MRFCGVAGAMSALLARVASLSACVREYATPTRRSSCSCASPLFCRSQLRSRQSGSFPSKPALQSAALIAPVQLEVVSCFWGKRWTNRGEVSGTLRSHGTAKEHPAVAIISLLEKLSAQARDLRSQPAAMHQQVGPASQRFSLLCTICRLHLVSDGPGARGTMQLYKWADKGRTISTNGVSCFFIRATR